MYPLDTFRDQLRFESVAHGRAALEQLLDRHGYAGGVFSTAYQFAPDSEVGEFLVASLWLRPKEVEPHRPQARYPRLLLTRRWLSRDEVLGLLVAASEPSDHLVLRDMMGDIAFARCRGERLYTQGFENHSRRAETIVVFETSKERPNVYHVPAVAMGLPPYVTLSKATAAWCFGQDAHVPYDLKHCGALCVIAPEVRAQIVDVQLDDGKLAFDLAAKDPTQFEVQLSFSGMHGTWGKTKTCERQAEHRFSETVPVEAERVDVFVLGPEGDLVTHFCNWLSYLDVSDNETKRAAEEEVDGGENEHVEFKPWITKGDAKKKMQEIIKAVVAFANTDGGRVYVGLTDHGEVQGLGPISNLGTTPELMLAEARRTLEHEIRNAVKPTPKFDVEIVQVQNSSVVVVSVERDDRRPYATAQNEVWVRRGATNRRPDPHSELGPMLSGRREP